MAGNKAKESELEKLHASVAKQLKMQVEAVMEMEVEGKKIKVSTASPALLGQAIKFLKDNSITSDIEQDENLGALDKVLKDKRKHGSVQLVSPIRAAGETNE